MDTMRLGRTGLTVNKNSFGALPIQRVDMGTACRILRKAYDNGINYFDTAHVYSDSEEKLGQALSHVRDKMILSSKAMAETTEEFWHQLNTSLKRLRTDFLKGEKHSIGSSASVHITVFVMRVGSTVNACPGSETKDRPKILRFQAFLCIAKNMGIG